MDEAHETLSGPATQKILYREFHGYGDERYQRLSTISMPHIYNLRKSRVYRERKICYQKTKPVQVNIDERRRPDPQGRPGYLRIDTVHQGDRDGAKQPLFRRIMKLAGLGVLDEAVAPFQLLGDLLALG